MIERLLAPLSEGWDGVVPGLPLSDTVKRVDGEAGGRDAFRVRSSSRCRHRRLSSRRFCGEALAGGVSEASDCASLVEARGGRVKVVEGDRRLLKVTDPDDLALVETWLAEARAS